MKIVDFIKILQALPDQQANLVYLDSIVGYSNPDVTVRDASTHAHAYVLITPGLEQNTTVLKRLATS